MIIRLSEEIEKALEIRILSGEFGGGLKEHGGRQSCLPSVDYPVVLGLPIVSLVDLVDHNRAAADFGGRLFIICVAHLVVIDDGIVIVPVPDLDAEQIHIRARRQPLVDGTQHEAIVTFAIDGARALILSLVSSHYQPVVAIGVEVQARDPELELGNSGRDRGSLLVLGDEPEVGLACERGVSRVCSFR